MRSLIEGSVAWLAMNRTSLLRYLLVGGWSYLVVTTVTLVCHEYLGSTEEVAFASGIMLALMINIVLLKKFVFRSEKGYWETGSKFVLTSVMVRGGEFFLFWILLRFGIYYLVASTAAMFLGASSKYLLLRAFVYR